VRGQESEGQRVRFVDCLQFLTFAAIMPHSARSTLTGSSARQRNGEEIQMKQEERAAQVWPVLVLAARNRQTLTYDLLGRLIGVPRQGLAHTLGHIMYWCKQNGYPPLTVLVVNQSGRPGEGLSTT